MRFFTTFYRSLKPSLRFLFAVNPGDASYGSSSMLTLMAICGFLILLSFVVHFWRRRIDNPITRKLSRSWSSAMFWFGIVGFIFIVCRVEQIQVLAMRFFWVIWWLCLVLYALFQMRQFRSRHYRVLPRETVLDPREKYLPGKKR
jgi:EamA domain-containing membrane protein RarD